MPEDLTTDLECLHKADPKTYLAINFFSKGLEGFDITENPNKLVKGDIIQGYIQRACVSRGWILWQLQTDKKSIVAIRHDKKTYRVKSDGSMVSTMLSCYLFALEVA
jgi:hypothetical protein